MVTSHADPPPGPSHARRQPDEAPQTPRRYADQTTASDRGAVTHLPPAGECVAVPTIARGSGAASRLGSVWAVHRDGEGGADLAHPMFCHPSQPFDEDDD